MLFSDTNEQEDSGQALCAELRIVVASSILLYRDGLAASITRDGRLIVVAQTDLDGAAEVAARMHPDALVLDASTACGRGIARYMKIAMPTLPVVGFGISGSPSEVIDCAESGLAGFIDQEKSIDDLVKTVGEAVRGEFSCSPRITSILCSRLARLAERGLAVATALTPREQEIAVMVADGLSNKEIAQGLRIGPATVKNHVHSILDKLHVRRRAAIASRVLETGR
jgi:two-component system nitrate/nitrite response regulator NarL